VLRPVKLRESLADDPAEVLRRLEKMPRHRVVDEHGRPYEQHHHVRLEAVGRGPPVARSVDQCLHGFGCPSALSRHDGGLRGDRVSALPRLPPAEQLIHDQNGDQQHQQP
jgi:hypothetical protein